MLRTIYFALLALLLGIDPVAGQNDWSYDYTGAKISLDIDPLREEIQGRVVYHLRIIRPTDSLYLDARDMVFNKVEVNGRKVDYSYDQNRVVIRKRVKPKKNYRLELAYKVHPRSAVYFLGWKDSIPGNEQIWTQGQGKYNSHWVPGPDFMGEKLVYRMDITVDSNYVLAANGRLMKTSLVGHKRKWVYQMERPMSSYLLAFAVGKYLRKQEQSNREVPLIQYIYPGDSLKTEPTYRFSKEIFDFLESEIGIPYPWQNYKQVPVRDFLYAGMENTGATFFSDAYVIDSIAFSDLNYVNVNAHELAHQWFGDLVTETDAGQHWLHEGLATYYASLAEQDIFGEDYVYWKLWDSAQLLRDQDEKGMGEALTDPGAGSLTFYEKGAWAAMLLRETVGDQAFRTGIRNFLEIYAFRNATVPQFYAVMEEACDCDLQGFRKRWMDSTGLPYQDCLEYLLENSEAIRMFHVLQSEITSKSTSKEDILKTHWNGFSSMELKRRLIMRYAKSLSPDFLTLVAGDGDMKLRQAIALSLPKVTPEIRSLFESFLKDPSYLTMENALYKLWVSFPENRFRYLELTRGKMGLPNKSLRMTWLLLAYLTPDFGDQSAKSGYERELRAYTSPYFGSEIRQNAFDLILKVIGPDDAYLRDLSEACVHHVWQFRNFARNLMGELLKDAAIRERIEQLRGNFGFREQTYLNEVLGL